MTKGNGQKAAAETGVVIVSMKYRVRDRVRVSRDWSSYCTCEVW